MLFDTASWPRGGTNLPLARRDDAAAFIHYDKGSAEDARTTPLRASTLPPHQFLIDVDGDVDGGGEPRSTSSSASGVASFRVGALTPLCPSAFSSFFPSSPRSCWFCVQALWPGQRGSEAWPPLPVSLSSSSSSSSLPRSPSLELRAPVASRRALDSYFSSCERLSLRVLPLDFERGGEPRERDDDDGEDDDCFLEASLPLLPGCCDGDGRSDGDEGDGGPSPSPSSPVATLSVSLRISVAGLERSFDGELDVVKRRRRRRRRAGKVEATTMREPLPPLPARPATAELEPKKRPATLPPPPPPPPPPPALGFPTPPEFRGQRALLTIEIAAVHLPSIWRPLLRQWSRSRRYRVSYRVFSASASASGSSSFSSATAAVPLLLCHSFELPSRPTTGGGALISARFGSVEEEGGGGAGASFARRTHRVRAGRGLAAALSGGGEPAAALPSPSSSSRSPAFPLAPPALFISVEALDSKNDGNDPDHHEGVLSSSSSSFSASASLPLRSLLRAPKSRARDPSKRALSTSAPLVRGQQQRGESEKNGSSRGGSSDKENAETGSRDSLLTPGAARVEVRIELDLDPSCSEGDEASEEEEEEEEERFEETRGQGEEREASPTLRLSEKPPPPPASRQVSLLRASFSSSSTSSSSSFSSSSSSSALLPAGIADWLGSDLNWRSRSGESDGSNKCGGGGGDGGAAADSRPDPPPPPPLAPPSFSSSPRNPLFTVDDYKDGSSDKGASRSPNPPSARSTKPVTVRVEAARGLLLPPAPPPPTSSSASSAFVAFEVAAAACGPAPGGGRSRRLVCTPLSPLISPPAGAAAGLCVTWGFVASGVVGASSSLLLHVWLRPREAESHADPAAFSGLALGGSLAAGEGGGPPAPPPRPAAAAGDELLGTASVSISSSRSFFPPSSPSSSSSSPFPGEFSRTWLPLVDARGDPRGELLVSVREEEEEHVEKARERAAEPLLPPPLPLPEPSPPAAAAATSPTTLRARLEADLAELDTLRESLRGGGRGRGRGGAGSVVGGVVVGGSDAAVASPQCLPSPPPPPSLPLQINRAEEVEDPQRLANLRRLSQVGVCSDDDADHSLAYALEESPSSSSGSDFGGGGLRWSEQLRERRQRASRLGQEAPPVPPPSSSPPAVAQERPLPPPGVPSVTLGAGAGLGGGGGGALTTAATAAATAAAAEAPRQQQRRPSALADDSWAFGCRRSSSDGAGTAAGSGPASRGISFSNSLPPPALDESFAAAAAASRPPQPLPLFQPEIENTTSTSTATETPPAPARPRFSFSNSLPPPAAD